MLKFLECLDSGERKKMKFLIAYAKNALIETRSIYPLGFSNPNNKPNNNDILNFAGDLLHEIVKMERDEKS